MTNFFKRAVFSMILMLGITSIQAQELSAELRKALPNLPDNAELTPTPMPGLVELRVGTEVMYVDTSGRFLIRGEVIDLKSKVNLTEARVNELMKVPFDQLPIKDGFQIVRGSGERKVVIFEDPNCGYCKRLERDMAAMDNLTVTVLLIPVLGADSRAKSQNIWCAKDPAQTWSDWMIDAITPPAAQCDTAAIDRNLAFAQANQITGTPTLFFVDGSRVPGAVPASQIEERLNALHP